MGTVLQVEKREELTRLTRVDSLSPLTINCLVTPGFGGRFYYPTKKGFITLHVKPADKNRNWNFSH